MIVENFKIKTKNNRHYYNILIFDTTRNMRKHGRKFEEDYKLTEKFTRKFKCTFLGIYRRDSDIGYLLFSRDSMSYCDIAHEITHASFFYDEHVNKRTSMNYKLMKYEERFAVINDQLTESFYKQLKTSPLIT